MSKIRVKALCVRQPWASLIAEGNKTIETRTWYTRYRGQLLICASRAKCENLPTGVALCLVDLVDCRPMKKEDQRAAQCEIYDRAFSWVLENIRPIEPFAVHGQLSIFEMSVDSDQLKSRKAQNENQKNS